MAVQRLTDIARRRYRLLVLGVILPSVAAFLIFDAQPQVYQVSATLLPEQMRLQGNPDYDTVSISRLVGLATNYAYVARSNELLSSVGQQLALTDSVAELAKRVDAIVNADTAVLTITARAGDASAAAALANAVAGAIVDESSGVQADAPLLADLDTVRNRMLETEADYRRLLALPPPRSEADSRALENSLILLRELTSLYDSLSASANKIPNGLAVVDAADPLIAQLIAPRTLYYTLLAAIAGLLIAAGLAALLEHLDDTVRSPEDVEEVANLANLGTIALPKGMRGRNAPSQLSALLHPRSGVAEAYRTLRAGIEFASADAPIRTLLVTSSVPGEGRTVTAANLAVVFAQAGHRVLLVDADLRKPGVHLLFDLPNAHGLTTLLRSDDVSVDQVAHETKQANLRILTTGPLPPNPAELLGTQRIRTIVDRLKMGGDLLIFDSPPLEVATDSAILGSFLDGTLFVVAAGRSRRASVRLGRESLARARANVLGAVLYGRARDTFPGYHDDSTAARKTAVAPQRAVERANPT